VIVNGVEVGQDSVGVVRRFVESLQMSEGELAKTFNPFFG
jgi:hypothetical protein